MRYGLRRDIPQLSHGVASHDRRRNRSKRRVAPLLSLSLSSPVSIHRQGWTPKKGLDSSPPAIGDEGRRWRSRTLTTWSCGAPAPPPSAAGAAPRTSCSQSASPRAAASWRSSAAWPPPEFSSSPVRLLRSALSPSYLSHFRAFLRRDHVIIHRLELFGDGFLLFTASFLLDLVFYWHILLGHGKSTFLKCGLDL